MCPECRRQLYGSASRGRHGGYFPAYHCDHRGHYFRKTKKEFDKTIEDFVKCVNVAPVYIDGLLSAVGQAFDKQQLEVHKDATTIDIRVANLRSQVRQAVDKIKVVSSATTIKYLEEDIVKLETEIDDLTIARQTAEAQEPTNMEKMSAYVKYFLEHLEKLLLHYGNPVLQAKYFGVMFNKTPTYQDIVSGTPDISKITDINKVFVGKNCESETHGWI